MKSPLLVVALLATIVAADPQAAAQTPHITGIVLDGETLSPLPNAHVSARMGDWESGASTDLAGRFLLEAGQRERVVLTVSYVGFLVHRDTVAAGSDLRILLLPTAIDVNPITVTASRRPERRLDAPARVTVIDARQIENAGPSLTIAEHLKEAPSVDVVRTGLNQSRIVVRGFNDNLASNLLTLVDGRIARAPAVRLTALQLIPTSAADIDRIEVLSGPASALYGPNAANGVVHIVTKSAFEAPGTRISLTGGQQAIRSSSVRHAAAVNERWAYKLTAAYYTGEDFAYESPAEQDARRAAVASGMDPGRIGIRDPRVVNASGTARVEGRLAHGITLTLDGGFTRGNNIEVTPTGAGQIVGAGLAYGQARLRRGNLFVQTYGNFLNSGDSYFLRTGESFIDKSRLYVVQAQHFTQAGRTGLTYGFDWLRTVPRNEGTVSGGYEDEDTMNEPGVYLQADTDLKPWVSLTLAGRVDYHSKLESAYFSPRAALVLKPRSQHTVRLTYNRAFKSPASNQIFGDVLGARDLFGLGGLGAAFGVSGVTDLRAQGMITGFHFPRGAGGLPQFRSPFSGDRERLFDLHDPVMTAQMWDIARFSAVAGLASNLADSGLLSADAVEAASAALEAVLPRALSGLRNELKLLDLETQTFNVVPDVVDFAPLDVTRTETIEVGYQGLLGQGTVLGVDAYWSRVRGFVGPLVVGTPNVFLEPSTLHEALAEALPAALANNPEAATALMELDSAPFVGGRNGTPAEELAVLLSTGLAAAIPMGTVSPIESFDPTAIVLMRQNLDDISLWGLDLSVLQFLSRALRVGATLAWVSADQFRSQATTVALNAPRKKYGLFAQYDRGLWTGAASLRGADGFPVRSDVYLGATEAYAVIDLAMGYRVRRDSRLSLTVQNILDNRHRQFVDVAELGRVAMLRLEIGL